MSGSAAVLLALVGGLQSDSVPIRLVVERSIPGVAVGRLIVDADGQASYRDPSTDSARVIRLGRSEVRQLRRLLETKRLCRIRSEPEGRLANYVTIESRWPALRCRVRRTEAGWRALTGGRVIFESVQTLLKRTCGADACPHAAEHR